MRLLIAACLFAISFAQTVAVLSNGEELSVQSAGLRCSTANLVFNDIVGSEVECAEQALLIDPDTPVYFSFRPDRNKCEIPAAANGAADCSSTLADANPKWTIYIISDAAAPDDECGVPGGDGSSCAGCDGVPNSGAEDDLCGVCEGSNACVGCDGIANSGAEVDACGVCGGDGSTCAGCDGVPGSGLTVDVCGVCGGNGSSCCSSSSECGADAYCNFDETTTGTCEQCSNVATTCSEQDFDTSQGQDACEAVCERGGFGTVDTVQCTADYPYAGVDGRGDGICCDSADCSGITGYCIDQENQVYGERCLDYFGMVDTVRCTADYPYAGVDGRGDGICCDSADCSGITGYCIDQENQVYGERCLDYVESDCAYPQPMCRMQKIFADDRGSETDKETRFFAIGKHVKSTLRDNAMEDGSKPLAKWMWRQMKDIVKSEGYSRRSFWRLEKQFENLLVYYDEHYIEIEDIIVMG